MATFIGYRDIEYTNKKGVLVKGRELFFTEPVTFGAGDQPILCRSYDRVRAGFFVSADRFDSLCSVDLTVGVSYDLMFDRYGNLIHCE